MRQRMRRNVYWGPLCVGLSLVGWSVFLAFYGEVGAGDIATSLGVAFAAGLNICTAFWAPLVDQANDRSKRALEMVERQNSRAIREPSRN